MVVLNTMTLEERVSYGTTLMAFWASVMGKTRHWETVARMKVTYYENWLRNGCASYYRNTEDKK